MSIRPDTKEANTISFDNGLIMEPYACSGSLGAERRCREYDRRFVLCSWNVTFDLVFSSCMHGKPRNVDSQRGTDFMQAV